jgi:undecaprenyl-diphosphatase
VFAVAAWVARYEALAALDHGARSIVRDDPALPLFRPMRMIGRIASGYVLLAVAVAWSIVLWRRRHRAIALALPLVGVAAVVALGLMKWLIDKPRPSLRGYGFPSGHVFGVTVFVMMAVYLLWRFDVSRPWQWAARAAGVALIVLVGYSRLYVNAHWFSDVVGGLLVGLAFAVGAMLVIDRHPRPPA